MSESDHGYQCEICGKTFNTAGKKGCHKRWDHSEEYTQKSIHCEIQRLAEQKGRPPVVAEINNEGRVCAATVKNQFGSWNAALRAAGFKPNLAQNISKTDLLEKLHRLAREFGHPPTSAEVRAEGHIRVKRTGINSEVGTTHFSKPGLSRIARLG